MKHATLPFGGYPDTDEMHQNIAIQFDSLIRVSSVFNPWLTLPLRDSY